MRVNALSATLVLLSLSALALAAVDGLSVKRQVKEGQVLKMSLKGNFELQGQTAVYTASAEEKITKVDADGAYTQQNQQHDAKASVGGQDIDIPDTPMVESVYNADGTLKEIKGDDSIASSSAYRVADLQSIIDAGKPLNVGDTWSVDIKANPKTGAVAAKADYKILAEEKIGDVDTVKVQATVKETSGDQPATNEATYWLSKADASLVKGEMKWSNVPIPGAPAPISGTMVMTRTNASG